MLNQRVALILRAGRPHYLNALAGLMQSIGRYHKRTAYIFKLYLAYDSGGKPSDDEVHDATKMLQQSGARFEEITFLTDQGRQDVIDAVRGMLSVPDEVLEVIFARVPYSFQLNCALMAALLDAMDIALLFDDDGYFWVPVDAQNGGLRWIHADPVGDHLRALDSGASVSVGRIAGAKSPIPEALSGALPHEILCQLGTFFEGANEVLGKASFLSSGYQPLQDDAALELDAYRRDRDWVTPANMGIKLSSSFPVFFNPKGTRGEDAFFALAMNKDDTLQKIPSPIFHDPFNHFPSIALGDVPPALGKYPITQEMLTRFRKALFGWISYMPLFLRLTHASTVEKVLLDLRARRALLEPLAEALGTHLNDAHYKKLVACFDTYCASVENDRVDWLQANHYWRRLILPAVQQSLGQGTELQTQRSISLSKVRERASDE